LFVNRAYAAMLGRTPEEIVDKPIVEIMGAEGYEKIRPFVEKVLQGEVVEYEEEVPFKDVGGRFLRVIYRPDKDEQGQVRGWVASISDITERKRAEQALQHAHEKLARHAEDLEKIVAERTAELRKTIGELESFSYSLSHDMRAPLRAMQSFSQIVLGDYADKLGPTGKDFLKRIVQAAGRMDRLIQDVLTLTRISRQEVHIRTVDVELLLGEIIRERPELQPPRADITVLSPLLPLRGHEASLTQCLTNLLGNAVKFVGEGVRPQVRIWTEQVQAVESQMNPSEPASWVRLWIEDNGIGIEAEQQQKIFEMFHRLHGDGAYEGTGIGLAIVRKAVGRMGGTAGVESQPGKGSRFWVALPGANA
jgi:PAS domain S-box-containing protein